MELTDRLRQLDELTASLAALKDRALKAITVMAAAEGTVGNTKVHRGGSHLNLGEEVDRGFITSLSSTDVLKVPQQQSGRLQLGQWLTDSSSPAAHMAARVMVNRVWHWHFGQGIVATPDDFGARSSRPTHPQLLDYLAGQFMRDGWSLKRLHRLIVTSATYRMASSFDSPQARDADPANRLLWKQQLLRKLADRQSAVDGHDQRLEARIQSFELAFRMQTAAPEALDVAQESQATRKLYGLDDKTTENFGLQCLLARRLAERGVRFIQVSHAHTLKFSNEQWDQHTHLVKGPSINVAQIDKPITGLILDLKSRGMLDDTLVIWGGEFGRTPTVQKGKAEPGRDHHPEGFTMWMAGGGVKGGFRYGETDEFGYYAVKDRCTIHDWHATILHLMGLDHEKLTYSYAGREFRLTDVYGKVAHGIIA